MTYRGTVKTQHEYKDRPQQELLQVLEIIKRHNQSFNIQ